jgi:replicative DNA helicase
MAVHVELQIISAILQDRDLKSAQQVGLAPRHFGEPKAQAAYEFLIRFADANNGDVPDLATFLTRSGFPDYVEIDEHMQVASLAKEIVKLSKTRELEGIVPSHADIVQDPDKALHELISKARDIAIGHGDQMTINFSKSMRNMLDKAKGGKLWRIGLPYPWPSLNSASLGMQPKELIVLYGRPGSLKTFVLLAIAAHLMKERPDIEIMVYSAEMESELIEPRLAAMLSGIDYQKVREGTLSELEMQKLAWEVSNIESGVYGNLHICYPEDMHIEELLRQVDILRPDILLVDGMSYLTTIENVEADDKKSLARGMKIQRALAKEKNIPIVTVFHANRKKSDTQGVSTGGDDLFGADAVAQRCNTMYRLYKYVDDDDLTKVMLQVSKCREFDIGGLIINPPPTGDWSELELLRTPAAVEFELLKLANRGKKSKKASISGLDKYSSEEGK